MASWLKQMCGAIQHTFECALLPCSSVSLYQVQRVPFNKGPQQGKNETKALPTHGANCCGNVPATMRCCKPQRVGLTHVYTIVPAGVSPPHHRALCISTQQPGQTCRRINVHLLFACSSAQSTKCPGTQRLRPSSSATNGSCSHSTLYQCCGVLAS